MQLQEICHRDLKLENTLLDGSPTPRVKICDFGYSKVLYVDIELALFCILTLPVTDFSSSNQLQTSLMCFSVCLAAFQTKIDSWHSSLHSAWGSFQKRVWWQGEWLIAISFPFFCGKIPSSPLYYVSIMYLYYSTIYRKNEFFLWELS